jgi:hypothetical protein
MSRIGKHGKMLAALAARGLALAAILAAGALAPIARAQYVGHVDANQDNHAPTLRATAVLEYLGDLAKPNASRLIPIAVWDGERYQPGGLYLAQPVPLTVESGTQYVLQVAGTPKGLFNVKAATNVEGSWIAIGAYQKPAPPNYAKLKRSRNLPRIFVEDDKPHFAHVPPADSGSNTASDSKGKQSSAPPVDPDRPTLHRRTDDGSAQSTPSSPGDTGTASKTASTADPDRPTLHRQTNSSSNGENETSTTTVDPNRPRLEYGRPKELEPLDAPSIVEISRLAGTPVDLEQIAAVSDASNREPHSYVYSWTDPNDKKKAQTALEGIAQQLLAKSPQNVTIIDTNAERVTNTVTHPRTARRRSLRAALPALSDEQFKAYELSYGGGATVVFSATSGSGQAARYITVIAKLDFNGTPLVLFKQIATQHDLDVTPRMKLIDAVDTDADNRAELIFCLENTTGRQYAIYRVANNTVEQVFTTGS